MRYLQSDDLSLLARGAAILGSGGGGDPSYEILLARSEIERYGAIRLLQVSDLRDDDLVVPVAFMGAPLISREKLPSGKEFIAIFDRIEKSLGKRPTVIMPAEIGGANAFTPLCIAGVLGLPVLDADIIGRAFPEIQMSVCNLHGIPPAPAFLADSQGRCVEITASNAHELEKEAREKTIAFGSSAAIACYLMTGKEAKKVVVEGSISRAISLGKRMEGNLLASGMIVRITQEIRNGFLEGSLQLDSGVQIVYRNEYLLATLAGKILAATPDILAILEQESGTPITSESLQYGLRVDLWALSAPEVWKSEAGMQLVGLEALCLPSV